MAHRISRDPDVRHALSGQDERARQYCISCRFIERSEGIILLGPTGTGKTHLAKAIAHTSHQIVIKGQSYRKNSRSKQTRKAHEIDTLHALDGKRYTCNLKSGNSLTILSLETANR